MGSAALQREVDVFHGGGLRAQELSPLPFSSDR
jgi:hypothetical protein